MGRPKGSKNKVKRGPGRPAAKRRGRPPMAKRGRPPGRPKMAVRRGKPAGSVARAPQAQLAFNPVDWMPLITAVVDLIKMVREIMAKENGVDAPVTAASPRTSPSFAKAVAAKAEQDAAPIFKGAKKRGRPKKAETADATNPSLTVKAAPAAETQEEMELEDPLDTGDIDDELGDDLLDEEFGEDELNYPVDAVEEL